MYYFLFHIKTYLLYTVYGIVKSLNSKGCTIVTKVDKITKANQVYTLSLRACVSGGGVELARGRGNNYYGVHRLEIQGTRTLLPKFSLEKQASEATPVTRHDRPSVTPRSTSDRNPKT